MAETSEHGHVAKEDLVLCLNALVSIRDNIKGKLDSISYQVACLCAHLPTTQQTVKFNGFTAKLPKDITPMSLIQMEIKSDDGKEVRRSAPCATCHFHFSCHSCILWNMVL